MCRSANEAGGPRRCSADARARFANAGTEVAVLESRHRQLVERVHGRAVPAGFDGQQFDALCRTGIRAWGRESATDFPVIKARAGDPAVWGFEPDRFGGVALWDDVDHDELAEFFDTEVSAAEREAVIDYTGGWSYGINAAIAHDEPPPATADERRRAEQVVAVCARYTGRPAADRPVAGLARGSRIPDGWGSTESFLAAVYPVGARVETGRVMSMSTNLRVAMRFAVDECADADRASYVCVVQTRSALSLHPVALDPFENESILGPGRSLRCVHVDRCGVAGLPTVYLVDEEIVARRQAAADRRAGAA